LNSVDRVEVALAEARAEAHLDGMKERLILIICESV